MAPLEAAGPPASGKDRLVRNLSKDAFGFH